MPLYEYECTACHRRTEKIQKFSDPEITVCPFCSEPLERVLSAPAVAFKGGGWYADGYGNAKPKSGSESKGGSGEKLSDSASKPASDSSASAKSTPAAATAAAPAPASSAPASPASGSSTK